MPRIILIKCVIIIQKNRPLIPRNGQFSSTKLLLDSVKVLISKEGKKGGRVCFASAYSWSDQSTPAGQSKAPVISWLKPLSAFVLRGMGGTRGSPVAVSQSMIADFKLLVSSDLAPEAPFCSCKIIRVSNAEHMLPPTIVAIDWSCSSVVEGSINCSSSPGTIFIKRRKTVCSRCSLIKR